jgi:predicted DCC family thiol-disulfide oxidoreductase YuxK
MAPATDPFSALLIFDGDCGFCTTAVTWATRILPAMPHASPFQWTDLELYGVTPVEAAHRVWFVADGQRFGGAAAMAAILRRQPIAALRFCGWLGTVPPWSWIAALGYRVVARYRHKLPGGTPACKMPAGV